MGRSLPYACASCLGVLLSACGLTADFSGLQGGSPPDGGATDAGATDAGASEAADAPSTPGAGFCASLSPAPKLCADFDEGGPVAQGWTLLDTSQGVTVAVDSVALSPPGSFLSAFDSSTPAPVSARLQESIPALSTQVRIEFQMLLSPSPGSFELAVVHQTTADGTTYGLFYKEDSGQLTAYLKTLNTDGSVTQQTDPLGPPPTGWLHVEMDLTVGTPGSYVIKHDGAVVVSHQNIATSTPTRTQMFVELGFYSWMSAMGSARFDDVVVDWH